MQLTPDEQHLFEQLGRNPVFMQWLDKMEAPQLKVLKVNTKLEQLCQAQGQMAVLDEIRANCQRR